MPAANYDFGDPNLYGMGQYGMPMPSLTSAQAPSITRMPWDSAFSTDGFTGQPDYLKSLQSPDLAGLDFTAASGSGDQGIFGNLFGGGALGGFLGKTENGVTTQGWGGMALGAAQGIGNAWMGMKQYGLAKDQLAQSKKQFDLNFGAQRKTTNAALEDRQAARVASNPGAYQSVSEYMKKNGI